MNCKVYGATHGRTTVEIPANLVDKLAITVMQLVSAYKVGADISRNPGVPMVVSVDLPKTSKEGERFRKDIEAAIAEAEESIAAKA